LLAFGHGRFPLKTRRPAKPNKYLIGCKSGIQNGRRQGELKSFEPAPGGLRIHLADHPHGAALYELRL
jgi:hypothetical protein